MEVTHSTYQEQADRARVKPARATTVLTLSLVLAVVCWLFSMSVGAAKIDVITIWNAIFQFNSDLTEHIIVRDLRLPRAIVGAVVGACFAVAGAIMQGMTRNPLAGPGIVGVNAGAGFFVILAFALHPDPPYSLLMVYSFLGGVFGTALVYGIGTMAKGGLTPLRLALAGAAVTALLSSFAGALNIYHQLAQDVMFFYAGGVAGVKWEQVRMLVPWATAGLVGSLLISRQITVLSLGEEIAVNLGQRIGLIKAAGALVALLMVGAAVSTAGPIGFVGLIIPHIVRYVVGMDYRWIIPVSAVFGGVLVTVADIGARMINQPLETPIGVFTAIIGVPFFLYLARSKGAREL